MRPAIALLDDILIIYNILMVGKTNCTLATLLGVRPSMRKHSNVKGMDSRG